MIPPRICMPPASIRRHRCAPPSRGWWPRRPTRKRRWGRRARPSEHRRRPNARDHRCRRASTKTRNPPPRRAASRRERRRSRDRAILRHPSLPTWNRIPRDRRAHQRKTRHRRFSHRISRHHQRSHRWVPLCMPCRHGVRHSEAGRRQRRRFSGRSLHPVRFRESRRIGCIPDTVAANRNHNMKRRVEPLPRRTHRHPPVGIVGKGGPSTKGLRPPIPTGFS